MTSTLRVSPSHQKYLDAGLIVTRTEVGVGNPRVPTEMHFYGPCRVCGNDLQDVDDRGFEAVSQSPYTSNYYGEPDATICTSCAGRLYRESIDLTGRMAKCHYKNGRDGRAHANGPVVSSFSLAFFEHKPNEEFDTYYCGCWGWD